MVKKFYKMIAILLLTEFFMINLRGCFIWQSETIYNLNEEQVQALEELFEFDFPDDMSIQKCYFERGQDAYVIATSRFSHQDFRNYIATFPEQDIRDYGSGGCLYIPTDIQIRYYSEKGDEYIEFSAYHLEYKDIVETINKIK